MGRLTYVCATCSEHFTRKYSATRHNLSLHNGSGEIVRLLEYLLGRSSGRYLPSHPFWYRRTQKWETPAAHNYNSEFGLADSVGDPFRPGNGLEQAPDGNTYKNSHSSSPILQTSHKTIHQPYGTQSPETSLKIKELKRLLNKHHFPNANTILEWAVLSGKADQNYLNEKLAQLRKIDILRI
jgi:hypothetical protein